jgi:formate/nitrite transporter FocA (FNT family)
MTSAPRRHPLRPVADGTPPTSEGVENAFHRTVTAGERRLTRTWPGLLATGAVGGIDVALGVVAMLLVLHETGNLVAGALAFGIGFIALSLAGSELFTENFLVPLAAVITRRAPARSVLRLWAGTAATNMVGGWVVTGLAVLAVPSLSSTAVQASRIFVEWSPLRLFASAVLAGTVMTLMTWMQRGAETVGGKVVAAVVAAFLLGTGHLAHAIVGSLEMFAGLHAGAPFGYLDWLRVFLVATAGNVVGGVGLVSVLRFVQVGRTTLARETVRDG